VKLFDRYKDVEVFNGRLEEQKKKLAAYREARKYRFVPDLVGGKTQYDENVAQIRSLQVELDNLTSEQVEDQKEVDIEKSASSLNCRQASCALKLRCSQNSAG
jgi:DNA repair ATPase